MIFNWEDKKFCWHIMIPAKSCSSENFIIASCTDPSIIDEPVPGGLSRHVNSVTKERPNGTLSGYPYEEIELKYSNICLDCIKLNDIEEIKFELIVLKLKGQK